MMEFSMINHVRIAEILHQAVTDELLRKDGERQAYEDFMTNLSPEENMDKVYTYVQDERALAEMTKEEYPSYEDYMDARGRLDAYDKIEKALIDHGE